MPQEQQDDKASAFDDVLEGRSSSRRDKICHMHVYYI